MESSFVFSKRAGLAKLEPRDSVKLQYAKCLVVDQTGEVEVEWSKEVSVDAEGELAQKPLVAGKSKNVYSVRSSGFYVQGVTNYFLEQLTIKDKAYVAKRLCQRRFASSR